MNKDEALKMAIEALDSCDINIGYNGDSQYYDEKLVEKAFTACKEALEQPAQEPVAWMYENHNIKKYQEHRDASLVLQYGYQETPLYPHSTLDSTPAIEQALSNQEGNKESNQQPAQEPVTLIEAVAIVLEGFNIPSDVRKILETAYYTHPHQWQGLTDNEIEILAIKKEFWWGFNNDKFAWKEYARAIEQALKEKNHG